MAKKWQIAQALRKRTGKSIYAVPDAIRSHLNNEIVEDFIEQAAGFIYSFEPGSRPAPDPLVDPPHQAATLIRKAAGLQLPMTTCFWIVFGRFLEDLLSVLGGVVGKGAMDHFSDNDEWLAVQWEPCAQTESGVVQLAKILLLVPAFATSLVITTTTAPSCDRER